MLCNKAINNLPDKIGVTANLAINYRAPTLADQVGVPHRVQHYLLQPFSVYRDQGAFGRQERP